MFSFNPAEVNYPETHFSLSSQEKTAVLGREQTNVLLLLCLSLLSYDEFKGHKKGSDT